ncbi:MAG: hypothetical protein JSV06_01095 [Myxococcales bacterium]|nr:MAG: hypothetical protein JSV06_01095 [Myxococcales bacterium]
MFNPKKMIPPLAAGALALTGCGGDESGSAGSGGSGGSDLEDALSAWCMNLAGCFPNSPYYQPTGFCISYHLNYYCLDESITPECEAAAISYFTCSAGLECADFYAPDECDDEGAAAEAACPCP